MKYLLSYKIFESETEERDFYDWDKMTVEEKKSKLFSIYPAIPLEKRAAAEAIRKIRIAEGEKEPSKLEDNEIHFPDKRPIDRLRWNQYFKSLIMSKEIRGHNFEGLIAGLYDGEFTKPGERGDLKIGDEKKVVSVKSLNDSSQSPVLGSVYDSLNREQLVQVGDRSIHTIFKNKISGEEEFRKGIWEAGFGGSNKVDYFLIAYFTEPSERSSGTIFIYIFSNDEMYDFINTGKGLNAPKNKGQSFQFRISSTYKAFKQVPITIRIPKIRERDLDSIWNSSARNWSNKVFGKTISRKMRTDTIEDILTNKDDISKRMSQS
jgi:hypothetical protein